MKIKFKKGQKVSSRTGNFVGYIWCNYNTQDWLVLSTPRDSRYNYKNYGSIEAFHRRHSLDMPYWQWIKPRNMELCNED